MFQLENAITNWRNGLLDNQNLTNSNIDELEGHLRDEIDSLVLAGLNEEEAFMVSTHRMGDQQTVGAEFAKINPSLVWRRRTFWMFFGILVSMVVSGISHLCLQGSSTLLTWLGVNARCGGVNAMLTHIGVFVGLILTVFVALGLLTKSIRTKLSMFTTVTTCVISILILKVASFSITVLEVNVFGMETFGQISLGSRYASLAWSILWPVIVVVMLLVLRSSRPQRVK